MVKAFLALLILLIGVDMAVWHGAGTATTIQLVEHIFHAIGATFRDSIFSR